MDNLFGISLTSIMISLLALMAGAFAVIGWIAWRNPLLARMGLRNIVRRKAQTVLIVVGLMLSTLIISAAFATGDTVGYSVTNEIYDAIGEADIVLVFDDDAGDSSGRDTLNDADLAAIRERFADDPDIDAITGVLSDALPALNRQARLSEPRSRFAGVDPDTVDGLHGILDPDGNILSASALGDDRAFITERLAEEIDFAAGATVTVFAGNEPHDLEVIGVVRDNAITGRGGVFGGGGGAPAGGGVVHIDVAREITGRASELDLIVVSVAGGVRDNVDRVGPMGDRIEEYLANAGVPVQVAFTKEEAVALGELVGSVFVTFFLIFGLFSIAAGVMLIFLIFIMLAAERRSEMGMARAVGMKRLHLTESFLAEGMIYNVGSAVVGALLGLGVAFLLVFVMGRIFSETEFAISYRVNPQGFVIAYGLGVVLTFATVAFSAYRAANLNIVRAIRDLPEPQPLRGADRSIGGLLKAALGALWYLVWLAIIALFAAVGIVLFVVTLGTYGIGVIPVGLLVAWFVFGARRAGGQRLTRPGVRRAATLLLWVLLPIFPLALSAWRTIRGDRAGARRALSTLLYAYWWVAFSAVALATWVLLRTRGWADRHRNGGGWAALMLMLGLILVYFGGWQTQFLFAYTGGTTLAVLAIAMLAVYFGAGARAAFTVAGAALVWYWLLPLPFSLFSEAGKEFIDPIDGVLRFVGLDPDPGEGNIEMFFVSGISITAAATLVVIFNADAILGIVSAFGRAFGGVAPAVRTAVAYPLAAKLRTAMTLAMFALVVFSLVVMSFLNFNFTQLFLGDDARAGFDVVVDGNHNNRIPDLRAALAEEGYDVDASIAGVGTLVSARANFRERDPAGDFNLYRLRGVDDEFLRLARLPLLTRATGYDSDEAVIEALRTDTSVAVVDASRFPVDDFGRFGEDDRFELSVTQSELEEAPWAPIPLFVRDSGTGEVVELKIIAITEPQLTSVLSQLLAVLVNRAVIERSFDGGDAEAFFVTTVDGSKQAADATAKGIESTLLERGVQAQSIPKIIDDAAGQSGAFQLLFEGFMGLGLIVGIAALGVIAFRTVVERRQQIGMLRAIGYTRRLIGLSFFLESSFIALTGIAMGVLLGSALSYNLLTSPEFTEGAEIDFQVPWLRLVLIGVIAYGASALMTLIPSRSASRVVPAEALRYE